MSRYFFHRTDGYVDHDNEGVELDSLSQARRRAIVFAGETLKEDPERVWGGQELYVEVTDSNNELLFTVRIECFAATRKIVGA